MKKSCFNYKITKAHSNYSLVDEFTTCTFHFSILYSCFIRQFFFFNLSSSHVCLLFIFMKCALIKKYFQPQLIPTDVQKYSKNESDFYHFLICYIFSRYATIFQFFFSIACWYALKYSKKIHSTAIKSIKVKKWNYNFQYSILSRI